MQEQYEINNELDYNKLQKNTSISKDTIFIADLIMKVMQKEK